MPNTPVLTLPYPALSDQPNGPSQLQALATATETAILDRSTKAKTLKIAQPTQTGFGTVNPGTNMTIATMNIADPGYTYQLCVWGAILIFSTTNEMIGQINLDNSSFLAVGAGNAPNAASLCWASQNYGGPDQGTLNLLEGISGNLTGAHTCYFILRNNAGASSATAYQGYSYRFQGRILPV